VKITANQVTLLRIFLLPIPSGFLLFADDAVMWVAFVVGALLGVTDFIDGYMARRDGPTILGGLLDPVADKLFVACILLPLVSKGDFPWWVVACVFCRELLITALRSSLALRQEKLTTSNLAKVKTVAQMGGLGVFFFLAYTPRTVALSTNIALASVFTLVALVLLVRGKSVPFWLKGAVPMWWVVNAAMVYLDPKSAGLVIFIVMAGLTVASGVDYLLGAGRIFVQQGLRTHDLTRVAWALAHGVGSMWLIKHHPATVIPLMLSLSAELAYGGIDNILCAEKQTPPKGTFIVTTVLALLLLALTLTAYTKEHMGTLVVAASVLAAVGWLNAARAFIAEWSFFKDAA